MTSSRQKLKKQGMSSLLEPPKWSWLCWHVASAQRNRFHISDVQNVERINFVLLSHHVCRNLSQQHRDTVRCLIWVRFDKTPGSAWWRENGIWRDIMRKETIVRMTALGEQWKNQLKDRTAFHGVRWKTISLESLIIPQHL